MTELWQVLSFLAFLGASGWAAAQIGAWAAQRSNAKRLRARRMPFRPLEMPESPRDVL